MLCHPGETQTDHTLRKHVGWKCLRTTVHDVCKKCPTCQRAKTTNQKYGKLPPKQAESNPWDTICVDLIVPYRVNPSITNRNCKDVDIRQQSKATSPVVVLKDYDPPVATATLLFYI